MSYPSADYDAKVARCYVCDEVYSTATKMIKVGPDKESPGKWIYRCRGCYAGSPMWMKHFFAKSALRHLFMGAEGNQLGPDQMRGLGRRIVEETKERLEHEICARLDNPRHVREVEGAGAKADKAPKRNGERRRRVSGKAEPASRVSTAPKMEGGTKVSGKRKSQRTATFRRGRG